MSAAFATRIDFSPWSYGFDYFDEWLRAVMAPVIPPTCHVVPRSSFTLWIACVTSVTQSRLESVFDAALQSVCSPSSMQSVHGSTTSAWQWVPVTMLSRVAFVMLQLLGTVAEPMKTTTLPPRMDSLGGATAGMASRHPPYPEHPPRCQVTYVTPPDLSQVPPAVRKRICNQYQRLGYCPFGSRCMFHHTVEGATEAEARAISRKAQHTQSNYPHDENISCPIQSIKPEALQPPKLALGDVTNLHGNRQRTVNHRDR